MFLYDRFDPGKQLVREEGETSGLLQLVEFNLAENLAVGIDGSRKGGGEPVEGDVGQDCFERRIFVGPAGCKCEL